MSDAAYADDLDESDLSLTSGAGGGLARIAKAEHQKTVHGQLTEQELVTIGADVVRDWNADVKSNTDWRAKAKEALKVASQEQPAATKTSMWTRGSSDVKYPLLTISAMAFHARAYPGIVKGDEAIKVKTFGNDKHGKKQARAKRMADYLNYLLFYKVEGWEADTDSFLLRLPIIGQHFRKVFHDPISKQTVIESISALRLTLPADAPSLERSPRITHDFDRYPHELQALMRSGEFRKVELVPEGDDEQASRVILEQHRMMDLDDDGLEEPYIVTVDATTSTVLRVEEAWDEDGIQADETGKVLSIKRWCPFVSIPFIPDPSGKAYAIGFGHLLTPIMDVVNTNINLMIDAGHAQVAGGGFISSEVRLQGAGQGGRLTFQPGEYKTVNSSAAEIRNGIYERTFPAPSPVLFQLLGMLMEAAKDIASVNDAITGDSARTAPVGTTLALIEQGQQVFNAIYKRIYRALREEFRLFAECQRKYGDPAEYGRFCDLDEPEAAAEMMGHNGGPELEQGEQPQQGMIPPQAGQMPAPAAPMSPEELFRADFESDDCDVQPISDPSAVTRAQKMAKAQFVLSLVPTGQIKPDEAVKQALEAGGIEGIDALMMGPQGPDPVQMQMMALEAGHKEAQTDKLKAGAVLDQAKAAEIAHQNTGAQADVALAHQAALTEKLHMDAFAAAAQGMAPPQVAEPAE